jgi:hypothetical protein
MNPWIAFVKEWVKENGGTYSQAIKDPRVSEAYKRIQRQSSTQQVARNVAQGKLSDIAEKAKAIPPKPKPLPKSSAVKAVFDSPYVRQKIMAFKPSIEEINRRRGKKKEAQQQLSAVAGKQMIDEGKDFDEVYGQTRWDVRRYVRLGQIYNFVVDVIDGDNFYSTDNDPDEELEELRKLLNKIEPLFKRPPAMSLFDFEIEFEEVGVEVEIGDPDEDENPEFYSFDDTAKGKIQEEVDIAEQLYEELSPEEIKKRKVQRERKDAQKKLETIANRQQSKDKKIYDKKLAAAKPKRDETQKSLRNIARVQMRNEAQQRAEATQPIRDTAQAELAALAQAQKPKKSRPAPVRRPKSK